MNELDFMKSVWERNTFGTPQSLRVTKAFFVCGIPHANWVVD